MYHEQKPSLVRKLRPCLILLSVLFLGQCAETASKAVPLSGVCPTNEQKEIATLVDLLGHCDFFSRNEAEAKLQAIGEPALPKLLEASVSNEDVEIRFRCRRLIRSINRGMARQDVSRWQGRWENGEEILIIKGDAWWWGQKANLRPNEFGKNRIQPISVSTQSDPRNRYTIVDLIVNIGPSPGKRCLAIFRLEDDTLLYCGSYKSRPTKFDDPSGYTVTWKRIRE